VKENSKVNELLSLKEFPSSQDLIIHETVATLKFFLENSFFFNLSLDIVLQEEENNQQLLQNLCKAVFELRYERRVACERACRITERSSLLRSFQAVCDPSKWKRIESMILLGYNILWLRVLNGRYIDLQVNLIDGDEENLGRYMQGIRRLNAVSPKGNSAEGESCMAPDTSYFLYFFIFRLIFYYISLRIFLTYSIHELKNIKNYLPLVELLYLLIYFIM
jgi:hypothetical protein